MWEGTTALTTYSYVSLVLYNFFFLNTCIALGFLKMMQLGGGVRVMTYMSCGLVKTGKEMGQTACTSQPPFPLEMLHVIRRILLS